MFFSMPARAPLDVDLEDKLLYGLTPTRLGYVVLAFLGGFALWSSRWAAAPVRGAACLVVVLTGATLGWGRWRGRAVDSWLTDIAAFLIRTQRVVWNERWADRLRRRPGRGVARRLLRKHELEPETSDESAGIGHPDAVIATG